MQRMFDAVAPRYELLNDIMSMGLHRLWERRMVASVIADHPEPGLLLDLCCGTLAVARRLPGEWRCIGVDLSADMLRRTPAQVGPERVLLVQANVLKLPLGDASVDAVIIAYGLRNVPDHDRLLAECRRVLRPGGRFYSLELTVPPGRCGGALYRLLLRTWVPLAGRVLAPAPGAYDYLAASINAFADGRHFRAALERQRWSVRRDVSLAGGMAWLVVATPD